MDDFYYTKRALDNREILICVMSHLLLRRWLARAARVDRRWFDTATDYLWQSSSYEALANVDGRDRQQMYARKIIEICFQGEPKPKFALAPGLEFPKLNEVTIFRCDTHHDSLYNMCLPFKSPMVEYLSITLSALDNRFLKQIPEIWPNLSDMDLGVREGRGATSQGFVDMLSPYSSIVRLQLQECDGVLDSVNDIWSLCAKHKKLQDFSMTVLTPDEIMLPILAEAPLAFTSLRAFQASLGFEGFYSMANRVGNLYELALRLSDVHGPILSVISRFSNLAHLHLWLPRNIELTSTEILSLCALSKLQDFSLDVNGVPGKVVEVESDADLDFTDDEFGKLVSAFPKLEDLMFDCESTLTGRSLGHLAEHCSQLRCCSFPRSEIDLKSLDLHSRTRIAFPELETLELGSLYPPEDEPSGTEWGDVAGLLDQLHKHFPELHWLNIEHQDRCHADALARIQEMLRKRKIQSAAEFDKAYAEKPIISEDQYTGATDEAQQSDGSEDSWDSDDDFFVPGPISIQFASSGTSVMVDPFRWRGFGEQLDTGSEFED